MWLPGGRDRAPRVRRALLAVTTAVAIWVLASPPARRLLHAQGFGPSSIVQYEIHATLSEAFKEEENWIGHHTAGQSSLSATADYIGQLQLEPMPDGTAAFEDYGKGASSGSFTYSSHTHSSVDGSPNYSDYKANGSGTIDRAGGSPPEFSEVGKGLTINGDIGASCQPASCVEDNSGSTSHACYVVGGAGLAAAESTESKPCMGLAAGFTIHPAIADRTVP
ncbi:MAG: hypothetical protein ACRD1V_03700, partial [Vicinamibacterales bacterium]